MEREVLSGAPAGELWQRLDEVVVEAPANDAGLLADRREIELFGLPFELVLIPGRGARAGIPGAQRPPFLPHAGTRIRRDEAFWRDDRVVATPNRYPFCWRALLLWPLAGHPREPDAAFLERCLEARDQLDAGLLINAIGASASIPLAHAHVVEPRSVLLASLELREVHRDAELRVCATAQGAPFFAAVLEAGAASVRARATRALLDTRMAPAFNVIAEHERVVVVPRLAEVPGPGFPFALGASELWGRFVYPDAAAFRRAGSGELEAALCSATFRPTDACVDGLRQLMPLI